jgi:hypothetical protein
MNVRTFLEGCGIGVALTISYTWQPLAPAHIQGLYLRVLPVSSVAGGAALDLIAASVLCWGLLALFESYDRGTRSPIWMLLIAVVPAVVVHSALRLAEVNFPVPSTVVIAVILLVPALIAWRLTPVAYLKLVSGFRGLYICLGVCIVWVVPELGYAAIHHEPADAMQTSRVQSSSQSRGETRLVWLLLDELSYDQTFEHRQAGLRLTNFDALRGVSISFANVQPEGYYTDLILPALLSGRPVSAIGSTMNGALRVWELNASQWTRFDSQETLFGDAERLGWSTGIAGWFNPYCRLFGDVVDSCMWEPESRVFPGHMSAANTILENALAPLGAKFHVDADSRLVAEHRAAYSILMQRALTLLRDGRTRFVFVHLPVPHPPSIYDRRSGEMRDGGSYLDNLVLADETVRVVRQAIDESGKGKDTILMVSSDHSMRVAKWRGGANWTAEDERVFGKRFDPRPFLLVHLPGESEGHTVSVALQEIREHDLIEGILAGRINADADLEGWINAEGGGTIH